MIQRRELLAGGAALGLAPAAFADAQAGKKVLRTAYKAAEVGFDPPQVSDETSVGVNSHIFEAPLAYDALARPSRLVPLTAAALPEVSADFRRYVFTLRPGIFFADDPAFKGPIPGKGRELVAEDYVYTIKRYGDPRLKSEHFYHFENAGILGLDALRKKALAAKSKGQAMDYDTPIAGLRALDRYRFEVRTAEPQPRLIHLFANAGLCGAVAREVAEAYGSDVAAHPVGTGPFRLKSWRRSSQIVLERNPSFREQFFEAEAPPDDADAQAMQRHLAGKRLPLLDEVEISIIEENQPRWLAFSGGELDALEMPTSVAPLVIPGGRLAPHLARRGVRTQRSFGADVKLTFFNFDDAHLGGYTPERVALRRAIALAYDNTEEIRGIFKGQAVPAQALMAPANYGFDPALKSEMGAGDAARANALLDTYGYRDVDGDGFREHPDGSPLVLRLAGVADQRQREIDEHWLKCMKAVGLRIRFEKGTFGELIKRTLAGSLQMWSYIWTLGAPDGDFFLGMGYGPNAGQSNDARFKLAAYDRLYERQRALPDGPERLALMRDCTRMMLAYMPYMAHWHAIRTDLTQARVRAYRRQPFNRDWWRYADIV